MSTTSGVIQVGGLTKAFGSRVAVDDLSFTVQSSRVTGFLGPNGAGKSTTLRAILGLVRPSKGHATVKGRPYAELDHPSRVVGALLETQQFHPHRTGRNHLRVLAAAGGFTRDRVDQVLDEVDLTKDAGKKVATYSLGMRQRLGLAAALLGDPEVLVLDEPANGLDPAGMRWLRGLLRSYASLGRTVFVSSHLLDEIAHMADEVVVVNGGRFVAHAPIRDLTETAARGVRVSTPQPERLRDALLGLGIEAEQVSASDVVASSDAETVWSVSVDAGTPLTSLQNEHRSLEDIFFELTSSREV